jgi:hypothetical protein
MSRDGPAGGAQARDGTRAPLRVELELEMDRQPVRGKVRSDGRSERFVGWLELAETLGRLHRRSRLGLRDAE